MRAAAIASHPAWQDAVVRHLPERHEVSVSGRPLQHARGVAAAVEHRAQLHDRIGPRLHILTHAWRDVCGKLGVRGAQHGGPVARVAPDEHAAIGAAES